MSRKREGRDKVQVIPLSRVSKDCISRPVLLHGLSGGGELWYRRGVQAPVRCGTCGEVKKIQAMYEYGIASSSRPADITWDGEVYCNLACVPYDTKSLRVERGHSRARSTTREEISQVARQRGIRLAARYLELDRNATALAKEEGVTRERMRHLLKKAGVRMPMSA